MNGCFYCKGNMTPGTRTSVVDLGKCIVIIKNVPCMECAQSGGFYYKDAVQQRLDEIVKAVSTATTEVAIVEYSAAA